MQIRGSNPVDQKSRFGRFVRFMGLPEDAVRLVRCEAWDQLLEEAESGDPRPLAVEFSSDMRIDAKDPWRLLQGGFRRDLNLFVFGPLGAYQDSGTPFPERTPEAPHRDAFPVSQVCFSDDGLWGPLQGLRAKWRVRSDFSKSVLERAPEDWQTLIAIDDQPWFLRHTARGSTRFLWNAEDLPDLSEPQAAPGEQDDQLLRLLPFLGFLRFVFGKRIWHAPTNFANLIIDDPPVRDRFGFFRPSRHIGVLADLKQTTTVGFIPWNWNRSTVAATKLFKAHSAEISLCIHGCDHTTFEFASPDQESLTAKCRLALKRAELLRRRTGLSCEPVMVFPQGRFSRAAISALRETDFLAAANSTLYPVDSLPNDVCIGDFLEPASTRIEDFPVFVRRYPDDPVLGAVDLFLGRPLLLVEHHEYFRDGYEKYRRFVQMVNSFRCRMSWAPLHHIVQRACLQRELESGTTEVRFYTNSFILENNSAETIWYNLKRRCDRPELIKQILIDGKPVDHSFENGEFSVSVKLTGHSSAHVRLIPDAPRADRILEGSLLYRAEVWGRRTLADLRANHRWISSLAEFFRKGCDAVFHIQKTASS